VFTGSWFCARQYIRECCLLACCFH
jgi:hypothetical protein